jgi:hypothetical protein
LSAGFFCALSNNKIMRRYLILPLLASLCFSTLKAQVDVPVDLLTGRPQISISLWNLQMGNVSAPIAVSYNGTGIRVEESEGTAGMGWNLAAGGAISRAVRSLPDDYAGSGGDLRKGWLEPGIASSVQSFNPTANDDLSVCTDEVNDYNTLNGFGYTKDIEPDLFYVSAPGLNFKFVFDASGGLTVKTIPYQDVKVTVAGQAGTSGRGRPRRRDPRG